MQADTEHSTQDSAASHSETPEAFVLGSLTSAAPGPTPASTSSASTSLAATSRLDLGELINARNALKPGAKAVVQANLDAL